MKPNSLPETVVLSGVLVGAIIGVALVVYWVMSDLFAAVFRALALP